MDLPAIWCTKCQAALTAEHFNHDYLTACLRCGAMVRVAAFPALLRQNASRPQMQTLVSDDEASCFYHPRKRAAVPCDGCGRFLCSLCDVEMDNKHLCPQCIELAASEDSQSSRTKAAASVDSFDDRRVLYDGTALLLAIVPAVVTPIIALYLAARYWRTPLSILPRTRVRWYLAVLISIAQLAFWYWVFFVLN